MFVLGVIGRKFNHTLYICGILLLNTCWANGC